MVSSKDGVGVVIRKTERYDHDLMKIEQNTESAYDSVANGPVTTRSVSESLTAVWYQTVVGGPENYTSIVIGWFFCFRFQSNSVDLVFTGSKATES